MPKQLHVLSDFVKGLRHAFALRTPPTSHLSLRAPRRAWVPELCRMLGPLVSVAVSDDSNMFRLQPNTLQTVATRRHPFRASRWRGMPEGFQVSLSARVVKVWRSWNLQPVTVSITRRLPLWAPRRACVVVEARVPEDRHVVSASFGSIVCGHPYALRAVCAWSRPLWTAARFRQLLVNSRVVELLPMAPGSR